MNRRQYIRQILNEVIDNLKIKRVDVYDFDLKQAPFGLVDIGVDENFGYLENGFANGYLRTQFIIQVYFDISKDILKLGKLTELSDGYIDRIQIELNKINENTLQNIEYNLLVRSVDIDTIYSSQSEINANYGVVTVIGNIRNEIFWK